jgi:hypothetical protein
MQSNQIDMHLQLRVGEGNSARAKKAYRLFTVIVALLRKSSDLGKLIV